MRYRCRCVDAARAELDKTDTRARMINSKLKKVESLPEMESVKVHGVDEV
ncbi:MAG TPA: hypothetical protein PK514_01975 [Spirochaetota bacterium]|nr:hypothetical protein [Spirochaetota bacterium]